jgi:hypothetical protein
MPDPKPVLTAQNLAQLYQVPASTIRKLIDRIGLGTRLGHWRIVLPTELERLEAGLQALGYKIPPATEQPIPEEDPQAAAAVEGGAPWD